MSFSSFMLPVVFVALLAGSAFATLIVIDNGDATGYSKTGDINDWSCSTNLEPTFSGDVSYSLKSVATATWSFSGLDNGIYEVYAIWLKHSLATTKAKYTISDSGGELLVKNVNQKTHVPDHDLKIMDNQLTPVDQWFEKLGTVAVADGTLEVTLSNANNDGSYIFADAVAIEAPEPATIGLLGIGSLLGILRHRRGC